MPLRLVRPVRCWLLAAFGLLQLAWSGALAATDFPMDGDWAGKVFSSGSGNCPSFEIAVAVTGHKAKALLRDARGQSIEMRFTVVGNGVFEGSFRTRANQTFRMDGSLKGDVWKGFVTHHSCQGSWYAKREATRQSGAAAPPSPGSAVSAGTSDIVVQMRVLRDLRQQDLIDEETYKARRAALLDRFLADSSGAENAAPKPAERVATVTTEGLRIGRYFALVIANNDYQSLPDLVTAVPDGKAVSRLLRDAYGFEVELLIDATRYDIITALSRYRAAMTVTDNLLIYYAGHGILDREAEQGYWIPVDGDLDNPANWVANSDITVAIRAIDAKHIMLVVDSCYSGTLSRGLESGLAESGSDLGWYRRVAAKKARTVLTSGGLEPVTDSGGGGHSVFAKAFLEVLRDNRGIIDGQSVFTGLRRPVVVNARQTPEYSDLRAVGHDGGDFLFVRR